MKQKYLATVPFVIILLLLQSCSVYQKTSVTLDDAAKSGMRAKVERTGQRDLYVKKIENRDGVYFGVKNTGAPPIRLKEEDIVSIKLLDKPKSELGNVLLIAGVAAAIGAFVLAATFTPF